MASAVGRTTFKFIVFNIYDGTALRNININSLSAVGVVYDEMELTAWQDAVKGRLPTWPDCPIEFGGIFDTTPVAATPSLSGSHTVLSGMNGVLTPRSLDIRFGIRAAPESDSPQFGITSTSTSGFIITKYQVDYGAMTYSARAVLIPGSSLAAFGTAAET